MKGEMKVTKYAVNWDNGNSACGTFADRFDPEEEAQQFADNWVSEMEVETAIGPESALGDEPYSAEVIEVEEPSEEEIEGQGWDHLGEIQRAGLNRGRP